MIEFTTTMVHKKNGLCDLRITSAFGKPILEVTNITTKKAAVLIEDMEKRAEG